MRKALTVAIIAVMLFGSLALLPAPTARAEDNLVQANTMRGYTISDEIIENFQSPSSLVTIEDGISYEYTTEGGLVLHLNKTVTGKNIKIESTGNSSAIELEWENKTGMVYFEYKIKFSTVWYVVRGYLIGPWLNAIEAGYYADSFTALTSKHNLYIGDKAYIAISRINNKFYVGINGIEIFTVDEQSSSNYEGINFVAYVPSSASTFTDDLHIYKYIYSDSQEIPTWHDTLHISEVPWGYDFAWGIQLHIDSQTYNMSIPLYEMFNKYGIKVTQTIWMHPPKNVLATSEDINYTAWRNFLLQQQQNGHEIATHAIENHNTNRTILIKELNEFKDIFGYYPGWVDHSGLQQDMYLNGTNSASEYYIYDFLQEHNAWIWVGKDGDINYEHELLSNINTGYANIETIKTYSFTFRTDFFEEGEELTNNMSFVMQGLALNDNMYIIHDYAVAMLYYQDPDGTKHGAMAYTMPYALDSSLVDNYTDVYNNPWIYDNNGGQWKVWEPVDQFYKTMAKKYSVWFATTREIVNRYKEMEHLSMTATASYVNITNNAGSSVAGVTIFTTEKPNYALYNPNNGMYYYPIKSNVTNVWHFVINNVPKLSELHLKKVKVSMPQLKIGSNPVAMWGDGSKLYIYAQKDGLVHVQPSFSVSSNTIVKDLTTGKTVSWEKGSVIFTAQAGHTYEIYDTMKQAINISIDWTYAIVNAMIPIAIFAVLLSALTQILQAVRKSVRFRK